MTERALRKYAEALLLDPEGWEHATVVSDDMGQYCMYCGWHSSSMLAKPVHELDCYARKLQEALAGDPDLVELLRWAYEELGYAGGGGEEAAAGALIERLEKQVDLTDEPPGYEYTE